MERLLRARELSDVTGVPVSTLYHMAAHGQIPHVRFGAKAVRFPQSAIERWIGQQMQGDSGQAASDAGAR